VVGRLIEVFSGKTLDQYLEERVLKPLHMIDTGFYVPESKWNRKHRQRG
jgi:CubicO group peptidase (beta-lactamase class C family)